MLPVMNVQERKEEIERLRSKAHALAVTLPDPFDVYDKDGKFFCKKDDNRELSLYEFLRKSQIMGYRQPIKLWKPWERILYSLDERGFVEFCEMPVGSDKYFLSLTPRYDAYLENKKKQKAKAEEETENGTYE